MKTVLLIVIFLLAFFLRFNELGVIPNGLAQDETSLGYNAYSLLQTGKDEYGKPWPTTFKAFGEYKLPGYIYLTMPSISVLGTTPLAVRLPSALFGFLTVVIFFFLIKTLTKNYWLSLIATLLLAINPWHIHFSRAAFEVVPALFFLLMGAYLFFQFIERKHCFFVILSSCFFVLSLYTYNTCRILAPFIFLMFFSFYRQKISFKKIGLWISLIPAAILLLPFVHDVFFGTGYSSVQGTLLYSSAPIQAQQQEFREYAFAQNPYLSLLFGRWVQNSFEYIRHIIAYFSPTFFFVSGSDHGNHGIGNVGMFYFFEFITVLAGLAAYSKRQQRWLTLLLCWGAGVILVAAFTREAPHGTRGFFLIPTIIALSAYGLSVIVSLLRKMSLPLRVGIITVGVLFIGINVTYYFTSYYGRFPLLYAKSWRSQDSELVDYLRKREQLYDRIIFDEKTNIIYTSLVYYLPYDPQRFQTEVIRYPDDSEGFSKVKSFGKYSIEGINWKKAEQYHKTIIVTIPENLPSNIKPTKEILYPARPLLISVGQEIIRPPVKDVAYIILDIP